MTGSSRAWFSKEHVDHLNGLLRAQAVLLSAEPYAAGVSSAEVTGRNLMALAGNSLKTWIRGKACLAISLWPQRQRWQSVLEPVYINLSEGECRRARRIYRERSVALINGKHTLNDLVMHLLQADCGSCSEKGTGVGSVPFFLELAYPRPSRARLQPQDLLTLKEIHAVIRYKCPSSLLARDYACSLGIWNCPKAKAWCRNHLQKYVAITDGARASINGRYLYIIPFLDEGRLRYDDGGAKWRFGFHGSVALYTEQRIADSVIAASALYELASEVLQIVKQHDVLQTEAAFREHRRLVTNFGHDAKRPAALLYCILHSRCPFREKLAEQLCLQMQRRYSAYSSLLVEPQDDPYEEALRRMIDDKKRVLEAETLSSIFHRECISLVLRVLFDGGIFAEIRSVLWPKDQHAEHSDKPAARQEESIPFWRSEAFWRMPQITNFVNAVASDDTAGAILALYHMGIDVRASAHRDLRVPSTLDVVQHKGREEGRLHTGLTFIMGEILSNFAKHTLLLRKQDLAFSRASNCQRLISLALEVLQHEKGGGVALRIRLTPGTDGEQIPRPLKLTGVGLLSLKAAFQAIGAEPGIVVPTDLGEFVPFFRVSKRSNIWDVLNIPRSAFVHDK